jgi:hypothetical protein
LVDVFNEVSTNPKTNETLQHLIFFIKDALMKDPEFYQETILFFYNIAIDPKMQETLKNFGYEVVMEPNMMKDLRNFSYEVVNTETFKKSFGNLMKTSFQNVMMDDDSRDQLNSFSDAIMNDKEIQIASNDAFWEAVKNSFFGYWYR